MNHRILLKAKQMDSFVILHLISREGHKQFWFDREVISQPVNGRLITKDGYSFAEIFPQKEYVEIKFTWLQDRGFDSFTAKTETIRAPKEFWDWMTLSTSGGRAVLALPKTGEMPKIKFRSKNNLQRVVENPVLRHKLSKFLSENFQWQNAKEIILTDDFQPYSFFFREETRNGNFGLCGGVILHKGDRGCYYGLHT